MNVGAFLEELLCFREKIQDEESKRLFDIRFEYFVNRDIDILERNIAEEALQYRNTASCPQLEYYWATYPEKKDMNVILFGAGFGGRCSLRSLRVLGIEPLYVVDNNYIAIGEVEGTKVENPAILKDEKKYAGAYVIVSIMDYQKKMEVYYQLLSYGIKAENILLLKEGSLWCDYGFQYFDLDALQVNPDGEIFVDAGCYNGMSSYNAQIWSQNRLKKVYAFEPDKNNFPLCESRIKSLDCEYELINAATWSKREELLFDENSFGQASKVCSTGSVCINANSIDNILDGRPATYIKLDVEGSELETLNGATNTIQKYRPKLAISLYHKPEDIVTLPLFIESLGMDYKYYIRHYQTRFCETVLYAI